MSPGLVVLNRQLEVSGWSFSKKPRPTSPGSRSCSTLKLLQLLRITCAAIEQAASRLSVQAVNMPFERPQSLYARSKLLPVNQMADL